jgi:hypothetical protein
LARISPNALLAVAEQLAGANAGRGRPREAAHRRAVSSAYYALFHRLSVDIAWSLLPGCSESEGYAAARSVSHTSIRTVCDWIGGNTPPQQLRPVLARLRANADLTQVALSFSRLQERREAADYDHLATFDKATTVQLVGQAGQAVGRSWNLRQTDDFRTFHGVVSLQLSLSGRR